MASSVSRRRVPSSTGLSVIELWSEPLVVVLPARHPLAGREAIALAWRPAGHGPLARTFIELATHARERGELAPPS
jgi:DNA-binding transcriptional LysR family regulator